MYFSFNFEISSRSGSLNDKIQIQFQFSSYKLEPEPTVLTHQSRHPPQHDSHRCLWAHSLIKLSRGLDSGPAIRKKKGYTMKHKEQTVEKG
jgi:hypothetical protein